MTAIDKLSNLQEVIFRITGNLYENLELLGNELYNSMLKDITEIYRQEVKLLLGEAKLDYEDRQYALDSQADLRKPAHAFLWFGRNEPANLIYREIFAKVSEDFNKRTNAVKRLEAALKNVTDSTNLPLAPQEPEQEPQSHDPEREPEPTDNKPTKPTDGQTATTEQPPQPDTAPSTPLTAKKKAVKPQPRDDNTIEQIQQKK